jgi:hypothetical protein
LIDGPEVVEGREFVQGELALHGLGDAGAVVEQKAPAVAADGEGGIEHLGIIQGLLHAVAERKDRPFDLDHDQWDVADGVEDEVCALRAALHLGALKPVGEGAADDDAPVGQPDLFAELLLRPAGADQRRDDVFGADIAFAELADVHAGVCPVIDSTRTHGCSL